MARPAALAISFPLSVRLNWQFLWMSLLLLVVAFVVITPLTLIFVNSFQITAPGEPAVYGMQGWRLAFSAPGMLSAMWNTASLAVVRQIIALVAGVILAWLLARTDIPMKSTLEFLFWLSFFLPALPITMGWILLLDPKLGMLNQWLMSLGIASGPVFDIYSFWGIVWVHITATTLGIRVMLLTPAFSNLDAAIEEASHVAGASSFRTLFRIVVPIMMPAILVSSILGLIRSLESFEIELLLGVPVGFHVYSTKIHELVTWEPPQFAPATALSSVFLGVLMMLVLVQRQMIGKRNYTTITGRGFSVRPIALGRWKYPAFALVMLVALTITIFPTVLLLMGTFMKLFGFFTIPDPWTLDNWREALGDPVLLRSFWNTIVVGLGAGAFGVIFYSFIAYVMVKSRFGGRHLLDFLSWLPWAIPGILLGVALLWTFLEFRIFLPIYGTIYLLIIAMIIKSMPLGAQLLKSVLMQLGNDLEEASTVCGGSWLQTYWKVILPLLTPALITIALIGFISAARDISTVVLLGTARTRTLSLLMLDFAAGAEFEKATVVAVITVGMVVVAALASRLLGGNIGLRG